jgi:hypothetical protein
MLLTFLVVENGFISFLDVKIFFQPIVPFGQSWRRPIEVFGRSYSANRVEPKLRHDRSSKSRTPGHPEIMDF